MPCTPAAGRRSHDSSDSDLSHPPCSRVPERLPQVCLVITCLRWGIRRGWLATARALDASRVPAYTRLRAMTDAVAPPARVPATAPPAPPASLSTSLNYAPGRRPCRTKTAQAFPLSATFPPKAQAALCIVRRVECSVCPIHASVRLRLALCPACKPASKRRPSALLEPLPGDDVGDRSAIGGISNGAAIIGS